jgi:hypothetical protein
MTRARRARIAPAGFFLPEGGSMANHLTPEELAKEMGMDRDEVVRICIEEGVPIYHGKIDKTLFQASLEAVGAEPRPLPDRARPEPGRRG